MRSEYFFVITGASGSGKSTLVAALAELGYACVHEVGRNIVREQLAARGRLLPWIDQPAFMEEVLTRNIADHTGALSLTGPVFFDRGIPECIAWARLLGVGVQPHHTSAAALYRYNPIVFVTEPWPEVYVTDLERRESFEVAVRAFEPTIEAYAKCGYRPLVVPKVAVAERVKFVLGHATNDA